MARFRNILGPIIRQFRVKAGLTQDEFAARLQLAGLHTFDRVTVAKIESQIRSIYDFEALVMAKVLKVGAEEFVAISHNTLKSALPHLLKGQSQD